DEFELTFNIQPKNKFYFNELKIDIPNDFDPINYKDLNDLFDDLKGKPYSLNTVEKIIDKIDLISVNDQFESVKASVNEEIINDQINLNFLIEKTEIYFVDRINIFGNNVTRENVIRNQLEIDEGDPFNEILHTRSINNIRSLNFFRNVKSEVIQNETSKDKIINISVEEKPTGEISAGAGFGTSGSTFMFGVKENNYLGQGIGLDANLTVSEESIKGLLGVTNPNYKDSDKSVYLNVQATEEDQLSNFGYKSNKTGFSLGTDFEYLRNLNLGLGTSSFYENIDTNTNASARQKKQKGDYWDTFLNLRFDYDVRNQKFRTTDGFRNIYAINIPVISETNTLTNSLNYKVFKELFENNITSASFIIKSANSLTNDDIKLSERLFVPSRRLRGFENGKIGPKDGADYIGGNYMATLNISTTLPQILPNAQNTDFLFFFDAGNVWGVDYDSSLEENSKIRSSIGIGVDFFTAIGPLNFSLSQPLSKASTDKTETFRFNIGTSF
ncbi:outer membrane protein assembly factor BamA, partial [Candidatus Pelagibacter sp.]|nr:outer membrane protein assembly factor BamA [Candidatus Pelagibacter sp.]